MMNEWGLLAMGGVALLWYQAMKSRELALGLARAACERMAAQLLDDTVSLTAMRPARDGDGRLRLRRFYQFEYMLEDLQRHQATLILLGDRLETLLVETNPGTRRLQ